MKPKPAQEIPAKQQFFGSHRYPFNRYEKDKVHFHVQQLKNEQDNFMYDTLVAIKVTEIVLEDRNQYGK